MYLRIPGFLVFTLVFQYFGLIGCKEAGRDIKDVRPIINEIFDMLLENIEAKKMNDIKRNNAISFSENGSLAGEGSKQIGEAPIESRDHIKQERIKVINKNIQIKDEKVIITLEVVTGTKYQNNTVLVFKEWKEKYMKLINDYGQLCSSSNLSSGFLVGLSDYHEKMESEESVLMFKMESGIKELENKTFLLCLSESITSNRSTYITKLSFSSRSEGGNVQDQSKKEIQTQNILGEYIFYETTQNDDDLIAVKTRVPWNQACSNYELLLKNPVKDVVVAKGDLISPGKNNKPKELTCLWKLKLKNSIFRDSNNQLEIMQRHNSSGSSELVYTVEFVPSSQQKKKNTGTYPGSLLFKFIFFILNLTPLVLISIGVYLLADEIWSSWPRRLPTPVTCNTHSKAPVESRVFRNDSSTRASKFSDFILLSNRILNSEESEFSCEENFNNTAGNDDTLKYFESDSSISTKTGAGARSNSVVQTSCNGTEIDV
ncbi:hypothetical protein HWI79_559 [Cryptosporidium felis]|nr:hypothetical protein HWI79_559 [Cryptosporidium felis]